ncbi:hypothetical protein [Aureivirga sp. CE67]|uniref:hypothetical protein n=1 Tax=Aureivirga sp. CE67 TaxID=1788983 RepID=UPI0018CBA7D4|nr:hypothetical protein [Aureivirga sp. CE67]
MIEIVNSIEDKVKNLLERYEFLSEENEFLHRQVAILNNQLLEMKLLMKEKDAEYNTLKIAKTIKGSGDTESATETKLKINALIREVDKCIVELNDE